MKHGSTEQDQAIGARIRLRRKDLGMTQGALADVLGVSFQQVQKYERGTNRVAAARLSLLAEKLDCTVSYLVGEEEGTVKDTATLRALMTPGAAELLDAYARIPSGGVQRAVLAIVRELAEEAG